MGKNHLELVSFVFLFSLMLPALFKEYTLNYTCLLYVWLYIDIYKSSAVECVWGGKGKCVSWQTEQAMPSSVWLTASGNTHLWKEKEVL